MESLMIIILIIILIICTLAVFYANIYNNFQDYIIRINEVESMIDTNLRNKYDLINRAIPIIKSSVPKEEVNFEEVIKLRSRKISNFELYRILTNATIELLTLKEKYNKELKSNEITKTLEEIQEIDIKVTNYIDYYNDNITTYNTLLKKFPSNIIGTISKYKEKLFFDRKDMNDEDYNDFKL